MRSIKDFQQTSTTIKCKQIQLKTLISLQPYTTKRANAKTTHIQCKIEYIVLVMSLKHTSHKKHTMPYLLNVRAVQRLNHGGQEPFFLKIAVHDSDMPVTLKQGQSHQTWNE